MLGRLGDVINIIPALYYEHQTTGIKPTLLTSRQFGNQIECGLNNYIEFRYFNGDNTTNGLNALAHLNKNRKKYKNYKITNLSYYRTTRNESTFLREAWSLTKCPKPFGSIPLIFDRDKDREKNLLNRFSFDGRKILLTAFRGHSSPYSGGDDLLKKLIKLLPEYDIIDLTNLKAAKFYDMLSLYERANALITIDTATLHLANATPELPVISLIGDKEPWQKSDYRENHILRIHYSEINSNIHRIAEAVRRGMNMKPKISFVTSGKKEKDCRTEFAVKTRENVLGWNNIQVTELYDEDLKRKNNGMPYVKDMIDEASKKVKNQDDIIFIANMDICLHPSILLWILEKMQSHDSVYFHRHDFNRLHGVLISESQIRAGRWYPGSDAFAFKKRWWIDHSKIYPDMVFGREAWDMVMRNMIKRSGGTEIHDAIYHHKHESYWEKNRECEENIYNKKLANEWIDKYGGDWNDWRLNPKQLERKYK